MSTVKVQSQTKGLVYRADVMVLQETRAEAVRGLDVIEAAIAKKEFQKLTPDQQSALREVRKLLVDMKPRES
jgi:hypothetical protein